MPQPDLILTPFAQDAPPSAVDNIPEARSPSDPLEKATWTQGFPGLTMIPLAAGGIPPRGQDVNGVLKAISEHVVFQGGGGQYKWSAEYVAAHGGYSAGAVIQSDDGLSSYVSSVDGNTINPNTTPGSIGNQWLASGGAAKADASTTISAGVGLTGGGDLSGNRTISANFGTTAGTVMEGNDPRIDGAAQKSANLSDLASASDARQNLELGTAAQRDVGTADGNVMEVGAGGWLKYPANYTADLNSQPQRSEIFAWTLGATGSPVGAGAGIYIARDVAAGHRLMFALDESRAWLQARMQSGGAFNAAVELITTGNISQNTPFGENQIPEDVTASRVIGTVYTNTTGAPIFLAIYTPAGTGASSISLSADGVSGWIETGVRSAASGHYQYAIVPPGWRYKSDAATIGKWVEWRKT